MLTRNPFIYTLSLYLYLLLFSKASTLWFLSMVLGLNPLLCHVGLFQLTNLVTWTLLKCFSFPEEWSKGLNCCSGVPKGDHVAVKLHGDFVCLPGGPTAFTKV